MGHLFVVHRGVKVAPGWPARIREAQVETTCQPNGVTMLRVRYGDEEDDWGADAQPCGDCAVIKGELHVPGCDIERCPACSGQIISCDCNWPDDAEAVTHSDDD
jgi:hypothetical protein